jgi:serine/threonine-protein kinase
MEHLSSALAGRYEIERALGQGGMATVYLARDLRHGRNVAIKVLRPELAARLGSGRFVQEIRVTANLLHPNILPLYDSGAADELLYYVMPYVEGESLRAKIERERQLSVEETVAIARAVASALDYAHEHGIVHRDIKPENILLQRGQALVADFGIALAVSAAAGATGERLTEFGISLGTPSYMSPEQAAGERTVDARSDIYSLGAVTYEMLTGDPPHRASTIQALGSKILTERPSPISRSRALVPANVDAAVQRALAKSPADRFARAAQFAEALADPDFRLPITGEVLQPVLGRRHELVLVVGGAALVLGLLAGWLLGRGPAGEASATNSVLSAVFFLSADSGPAVPGYPALSPNGAALVYPSGDAGSNRLYLRRLEDPNPTPIPASEGASFAFMSPDGEWAGFLAEQALKRVRLRDGSEAIIAPFVEGMAGATWREDDTILLSLLPRGALFEVPARGGTPAALVIRGEPLDSGFFFPHYLPGGRAIVFNTEPTGGLLGVLDLETGARKSFGPGLRPSYLASGRLVYANPEGRLVSQPFDLRRLEITGESVLLPEELGVGRGRAFYSVSRNGVLAIIRGVGTSLDINLFDRTGSSKLLVQNAGWTPRISPDGNLVAYGDGIPDDLWIYDLRTETRRRFTLEGASSNDPAWSPDGRELAFASDRPSRKDVLVRSIDGTGAERQLVVREGLQWPSDWSSNGYVVFTDVPLDEDRDIWAVKADGSEPPFAYLDTPFLEKSGDVSPDGRWIAYDSNAPGRFEVFVNSFPKAEAAPVMVSLGGGRHPRWGPGDRELFYWNGDELIALRLDLAGGPRVTSRTALFRASHAGVDHPGFDAHPDGKHFVVLIGRPRPQRMILALNPFRTQ